MGFCKRKRLVKMAGEGISVYLSAIVLGLNDALVELTGALAGFTMALQNNQLIVLAGLTTGISATLSMAAAEYLSQETDSNQHHPFRAALFTGGAYFITVALLLVPYLILDNPIESLAYCMIIATVIIMGFTYLYSHIHQTSFIHEFLQMLIISMGVAAIAFGLSWLARILWGINV